MNYLLKSDLFTGLVAMTEGTGLTFYLPLMRILNLHQNDAHLVLEQSFKFPRV
jgi:hypothetical protein